MLFPHTFQCGKNKPEYTIDAVPDYRDVLPGKRVVLYEGDVHVPEFDETVENLIAKAIKDKWQIDPLDEMAESAIRCAEDRERRKERSGS